jgi:tRNA U34 2-thiouridine synthase MnmA/TrmU
MKAIALFSSGLDSLLAVKLVQNQGIEVIALYFLVPFGRHSKENIDAVKKSASCLGVKLKIVELGENYFEIIKNPKYGYGKNLNPCIDCRIFMFNRAKEVMRRIDASFIITGEVLGQRPKSQNRKSFELIEKESGLEGLILRPLSAKLLKSTIVEDNRGVNRQNLLDISGRSRVVQIDLAAKLGIKEYPWPAGGCLLTESSFCARVEDLIEHKELNSDNVELLKIGRHFRVTSSYKLVVGRDEEENNRLLNFVKKGDLYFEPKDLPGPSGIGRGMVDEESKVISAQILARYTALDKVVEVIVKEDSREEFVSVKGISEGKLKKLRIV